MLECEVKKVEMFTPQSQVKKPRHVEVTDWRERSGSLT